MENKGCFPTGLQYKILKTDGKCRKKLDFQDMSAKKPIEKPRQRI